MEILERYLNQVKKHLPLKDREDTLEELRSLILEEFDSKSNKENDEELLVEIIKNYGYPIEVASRYRNNEPLISSRVRPYFNMAIKIVSFAVPLGILVGTTISFIEDINSFHFLDLLLEMAYAIPSIINALLFAYGMVFIIFILMNRYAIEEFKKEVSSFDPKTLPQIPKSVYKISIFEHVFEILMLVLFLYLLNYTEGLISLTIDGVKTPLLNKNFNNLLPFINISFFLSLGVLIFQLSKRSKTKLSVSIDLIQTYFFGTLLYILASNDIFTKSVIEDNNLDILPNIIRVALYIGAIASIIGSTISYIITIKKMKNS